MQAHHHSDHQAVPLNQSARRSLPAAPRAALAAILGLAFIHAAPGLATETNQPPLAPPSILSTNLSDAADTNSWFQAGELTLDLATTCSFAAPDGFAQLFNTKLRDGKVGTAFGLSYFPSRNFGFGLEALLTDLNHPNSMVLDAATLTVTARLPLGRVAPYAVAGVGRNFGESLYHTQLGAGLEWRWSRRLAAFSETRFVFQTRPSADTLLARAGVRIHF